jgi:hypothetical protein
MPLRAAEARVQHGSRAPVRCAVRTVSGTGRAIPGVHVLTGTTWIKINGMHEMIPFPTKFCAACARIRTVQHTASTVQRIAGVARVACAARAGSGPVNERRRQ